MSVILPLCQTIDLYSYACIKFNLCLMASNYTHYLLYKNGNGKEATTFFSKCHRTET